MELNNNFFFDIKENFSFKSKTIISQLLSADKIPSNILSFEGLIAIKSKNFIKLFGFVN